jgi:hypothetical protein
LRLTVLAAYAFGPFNGIVAGASERLPLIAGFSSPAFGRGDDPVGLVPAVTTCVSATTPA